MDFPMLIVASLALIVSIVSLRISYKASSKGNELSIAANNLTKTANEMQMGQVEMQIREMISAARSRYQDKVIQTKELETDEILIAVLESANEDVLNAYDEACAKYLDGKVDKERFKKLYHDEIRQLVNGDSNKEKYCEPHTKFHATNKVYTQWNNLET